MKILNRLILILVLAFSTSLALAEEKQLIGDLSSPSQRSNSINFDDELVEGMNKNPLDALTHVGKRDDRDQGYLFHTKANFRREMRQTIQEMGYTQ